MFLFLCTQFLGWGCQSTETTSHTVLLQDGYLWQRNWTKKHVQQIEQRRGDWNALYALVVEVEWEEEKAKSTWIENPPKTEGVVVRVWVPPESVDFASFLQRLCTQVRNRYPDVLDIQLDIDMPTDRILEYAEALETVSQPVSITALPDWLSSSHFPALIRSVEHYVLQVHWLDPNAPDHLLHPQTRAIVKKANGFGVPFQVALPTYGYRIYQEKGEILSVVAEESLVFDSSFQEVMANPQEIAELMTEWNTQHPQHLYGVIWFRFPFFSDRRNWPYKTLMAVREGRKPEKKGVVVRQKSGEQLWDISLKNTGESVFLLPTLCTQTHVLLADGLQDYRWEGNCFVPTKRGLRPDEELSIGWVRSALAPNFVSEVSYVDPIF